MNRKPIATAKTHYAGVWLGEANLNGIRHRLTMAKPGSLRFSVRPAYFQYRAMLVFHYVGTFGTKEYALDVRTFGLEYEAHEAAAKLNAALREDGI